MSDSARQPAPASSKVVFIDSNVSDLQDLLDGLAPGEEAFVLEPSSDGIAQIAAILSAEHLTDLASISIVGHGSPGAIVLGSTVFDGADLSVDAASLADIGSALAPGGDIALYACNTAAGAAGQQFIADLSQLTGGVDVAAATHLVGSADLGGSWTLDASTGAPVNSSGIPFTDSALADYNGALSSATYQVAATDPFPTLQFGARIVAADFNHDGKLDILYQQGNTAGQGIALALGNGDGTFQTPIAQPDGAAFTSGPLQGIELSSVVAGSTLFTPDLGGGGDIVADAGVNTTPIVYQYNGTDYVQIADPFPSQQFSGRLAFADFNGDGLVDALNQTGNVSGTGITLYVNNGDGTFTSYLQPTGGAFTSGPLAGIAFSEVVSSTIFPVDTNGDGKVDLIIDDQGAGAVPKVYLNSGSGFAQIASPFPAQQFTGRFVFGDFSGNGKVDILNQTGNQSGQGVTLYEYNGNGTFTAIAKPDDSTAGAGDAPFTSGPFTGIDFTQIVNSNFLEGDFRNNGAVDIVESQNGSSLELLQQPCYCSGTLIRTKRGQKKIEKLKIGDMVMTMSGAARSIKWIGWRSYGGRFIMGQKEILPICIKAGALDENVPRRDLWVSPHHAMFFEGASLKGALIEAKDLINGVSIVQAERIEKVEYFHIELETHDVLIAEGALSESFIDDDSHGMFHNAHKYNAPNVERSSPAHYCAPRLNEGYEVEAVRRRIAQRAGLLGAAGDRHIGGLRGSVDLVGPTCIAGWAQTIDAPETPVCLDIYADGRLIGQVLANAYREDLKRAGIGSGRHSFEFTPPRGLRISPHTVEVHRSLDGASLERSHKASKPRISSLKGDIDPTPHTDASFVKVYRRAARS